MREKGPSLNSASLTPKPLASSVYVHVLQAPSPLKRSILVMSPFPSPDLTHPTPTPTVPVAFHRTGIIQPGWVHGSAGSAGDNPQFSSPLLVALGAANPPCREAMILL